MRASSAATSTDRATRARLMGRDELSLALIDSRNNTLRWLAVFEDAGQLLGHAEAPGEQGASHPLYMAGRIAWLQEWWIARNLRRLAGEAAASGPRLAPLDDRLNNAFGVEAGILASDLDWPSASDVRSYLEATLEQTLELLATCPSSDLALYAYRSALQREDRLGEAFAVAAQSLGVAPPSELTGCAPLARAPQAAIWIPAQTAQLGSTPGGWVPPNERWAHDEKVPEFEIDAQAVSWERFVEFAEDGGYDREELWRPESWQWIEAHGRRAPRHVEQLRQGVLLSRFGVLQRAHGRQAVTHVSWHEADAWCRWAGRRLPTEVEWELAALTAAARGFVWCDVWEWAAGSARFWPGGPEEAAPSAGRRVLRGGSTWTHPRVAHPKQRRFVAAYRDDLFCGFRSCSL